MNLIEISTFLCICHSVKDHKVLKYKKSMENGDNFPPIEVVEKDGLYFVKDGNHRCHASHLIDQKVWAYVWQWCDYPNKHLIGRRISWTKTL